jgi:hypothetical protein
MLPSEQLDTELIESACRRAGKTQESHPHPELVLSLQPPLSRAAARLAAGHDA